MKKLFVISLYLMAVSVNKHELQIAIQTNYNKLLKELISISSDKAMQKELDGHAKGTSMSINNLLSYLIGWGELVLKWNKKKDHNEMVDFPETGYKWNELGKLAEKFHKDYEQDGFMALQEKLDKIVREILAMIDKKSNKELYQITWYEKWTLGRMIQFNTASPYTNAKGRILKWKKE